MDLSKSQHGMLVPGLCIKNLTIDETDDPGNNRLQVESSSLETDANNIGGFKPNEKVENAPCSIASATRQQREQQIPTSTSIMQNTLSERLEAKLLANKNECTELQMLVEARKRGIPVPLSLLHIGHELEKASCVGDSSYLLQKLEVLVLLKEEEYTKACKLLVERGIQVPQPSLYVGCDPEKVPCLGDGGLLKKLEALVLVNEEKRATLRTLLVEARTRDAPLARDGTVNCVSLSTRPKPPRPILRKEPSSLSSRSSKSVTWGPLTRIDI
jgi:hypothetical protein